ncbi:MAG: hypothetical protein WC180_00505 [Candidatus Paceibacterota bacterium]|jgi:hypothetical protein
MSLEATHLRFSFAIKNDLGVFDLEKYVAGVIYPDSRYLSGIDRHLTHSLDYFVGRKNLTDFEKGWLTHIIGDKIFGEVIEDKFADWVLFEEVGSRWPIVTAIKIIQDLEDFRSFNIQGVLDYLDYYEIHFHEDERKVIGYSEVIKNMYKSKDKITVEDGLLMSERLGMNRKEIALLRKKVVELYEDEKLIEIINDNFADGMDLYQEKYKQLIKNYAQ